MREEKFLSTPTKENIETVMRGFEEFFAHMVKTQGFNLQEFVNFMEPKFAAAGYRDTDKTIRGGNILILTEIATGDFILATGAIREVRRLYPNARITLVAHQRAFEFAECCPYVDELIINPQKFPIYNPFDFYKTNTPIAYRLLEQRFDICFAFVMQPHNPLLMYMSGAKVRVTALDHENTYKLNEIQALTEYLMHLATHLFPYTTYGYHRADRFFSLIENFLHLPIMNRKMEIWYTPSDFGFAKSHLKNISSPIYSLNMGGMRKYYPPEKYAKLLEMILRKEPTATFVILGGGQNDLQSAEILKKALPKTYEKNIIDLTNKLSFRQSAAVLRFCDMYIGNDTGTMHVAAAMNCPVLTPNCFAADLPVRNTDTPRRWYPYGVPSVIVQPKHALPECKNIQYYEPYGCAAGVPHCITQIEPETLFKGFKLLKKRVAAGINEPLYMS